MIPNWSELCPDLLRCVFERLSFTDLKRSKLVCSPWNSASKGCVPIPNLISWLILFPRKEGNRNNNTSCVLFVPADKDNVYKTRDLGVDLLWSHCLATYGSWLLMLHPLCNNLYILNPLTGERIDIPNTKSRFLRTSLHDTKASFWIDNKTKDYLVFLMLKDSNLFTKKGDNKWVEFPDHQWYKQAVYNHKNQKLYLYRNSEPIRIWDFSGDRPRRDGFLEFFRLDHDDLPDRKNLVEKKRRLAVTISGDVLIVSCCMVQGCKSWRFYVYKANHVNSKWLEINSLGDEALILDMGVTVVAKDVTGIKRNSIYFSGFGYDRDDQEDKFVYDLITQKMEPLPQCVFSSIRFSDARWFFPDFIG